jgi:hypothetical protein
LLLHTKVEFMPLEFRHEEGETAASAILSTPFRFGKPLREKLTGPLNTPPPHPTF